MNEDPLDYLNELTTEEIFLIIEGGVISEAEVAWYFCNQQWSEDPDVGDVPWHDYF